MDIKRIVTWPLEPGCLDYISQVLGFLPLGETVTWHPEETKLLHGGKDESAAELELLLFRDAKSYRISILVFFMLPQTNILGQSQDPPTVANLLGHFAGTSLINAYGQITDAMKLKLVIRYGIHMPEFYF
jgi:hypothetical protein